MKLSQYNDTYMYKATSKQRLGFGILELHNQVKRP